MIVARLRHLKVNIKFILRLHALIVCTNLA